MTDIDEFQKALEEAEAALSLWWDRYVAETRDDGEKPTAMHFAYWMIFTYAFDQGVEQATKGGAQIVALVDTSSVREVMTYECDFCQAPSGLTCVKEDGTALDRALFHISRYNKACNPEEIHT